MAKKILVLEDSGGPLIRFEDGQWQQVGIISYGGKQHGPRCGGPNAYGIATRVFEQLDFIKQQVPLPTVGAYDGVWISPFKAI
jgi:secreted trypsin-like serine protease